MAVASIRKILTTDWVKETFLPGIDLTDENGNPFSNEVFENALQSAIATTSQELDLVMDPIVVSNERHDMTDRERQSYFALYMTKRPMLPMSKEAGDKAEFVFGNQSLADFPLEWVTCMDPFYGYIHIIPQGDNLQKTLPIIVPSLSYFRYDYIPGWWRFRYRAGFQMYTGTAVIPQGQTSIAVPFAADEVFVKSDYYIQYALVSPNAGDVDQVPYAVDKQLDSMTLQVNRQTAAALTIRWYVTSIPDNLRKLIGIRAAKSPLAIAGNLVLGAGIQSKALGLDGMSQNIAAAKRGRGAFGDLLTAMEVEEAAILQGLLKSLRRVNFSSI